MSTAKKRTRKFLQHKAGAMLREILIMGGPEKAQEIADSLGYKRASLKYYIGQGGTPGPKAMRILAEKWGIPIVAWEIMHRPTMPTTGQPKTLHLRKAVADYLAGPPPVQEVEIEVKALDPMSDKEQKEFFLRRVPTNDEKLKAAMGLSNAELQEKVLGFVGSKPEVNHQEILSGLFDLNYKGKDQIHAIALTRRVSQILLDYGMQQHVLSGGNRKRTYYRRGYKPAPKVVKPQQIKAGYLNVTAAMKAADVYALDALAKQLNASRSATLKLAIEELITRLTKAA